MSDGVAGLVAWLFALRTLRAVYEKELRQLAELVPVETHSNSLFGAFSHELQQP
jgi:hypothetical protein